MCGIIGKAPESTSTAIGLKIFYFDLEIFLKSSSSEPLNTKIPPISSFFSRRLVYCRILSFYWLAKNPPKSYTILVGLRSVLYSRAVIQRVSHIFGRKDCRLCSYNPSAEEVGGFVDVFLYGAAQNFELFSNITDQNKKSETYSG
jgi:hypothetical protein